MTISYSKLWIYLKYIVLTWLIINFLASITSAFIMKYLTPLPENFLTLKEEASFAINQALVDIAKVKKLLDIDTNIQDKNIETIYQSACSNYQEYSNKIHNIYKQMREAYQSNSIQMFFMRSHIQELLSINKKFDAILNQCYKIYTAEVDQANIQECQNRTKLESVTDLPRNC